MDTPHNQVPVDLLAIGGGMAGLTAAAWVAHNGGRAVVVERAATVGGSAAYAGFVWTTPTFAGLREVNPHGDPELARALVDGFPGAIEWIRSLGVEARPPVTLLRYGRGHQMDTNHYIGTCERLVRAQGGELLLGTQVRSLLVDDDGVVGGAECVLADGTTRAIEARWTLLATGGFQGDPQLRAEHIHPQARDIELRSNPDSVGDGLRLGTTAGAAFGKPAAGFYGHLVPAGVRLGDPSLFVELALYYSEHALLFNLCGERFVDETAGDHLTAIALVEQPEARGLLVGDAAVYREWINGSYVEGLPGSNKFEICRRHGARCAVAESIDEFELIPKEWGYPGAKIRDAIEAFNLGMRSYGRVAPTREFDQRRIEEPPFYVVEVAPAISYTFGGLLVDSDARVRSTAGGTVPGLLAAGADMGGLYFNAYAGGLAPAVVFGLAAARSALADAGPAH